jgi:hypothetical protein
MNKHISRMRSIHTENSDLSKFDLQWGAAVDLMVKVKFSPLQALEALRVVRG